MEIVIDNGSYLIKAGLCGNDQPDVLKRSKGINYGVIEDWDYMTEKWLSIIEKDLLKEAKSAKVLTIHPYNTPNVVFDKMTEIFFESL